MVKKPYIPERGDIVWIDFDPQIGREQAKRRPALVLSPGHYNRHGLVLCCPVTTKIKGYPFEVTFDDDGIKQAVIADQVKCHDWHARKAIFKSKSPADLHRRVVWLLGALMTK